jgi:hypothetical protein
VLRFGEFVVSALGAAACRFGVGESAGGVHTEFFLGLVDRKVVEILLFHNRIEISGGKGIQSLRSLQKPDQRLLRIDGVSVYQFGLGFVFGMNLECVNKKIPP